MTAEETQRKVGITASRHGLFRSGYTCATMKISIRSKPLVSKSERFLTRIILLQLEDIKGESLVIANQESCGELVLGLCTNRPSRSERLFAASGKSGFFASGSKVNNSCR